MEQNIRPVLTIRLFGEEKCFGPGVAQLLHRTAEHHSLRAAALSMGMAYSKAWTVIRTAETQLGFRLLLSTTGGKNGGGASLTSEAQQLLSAYDAYSASLRRFAEEEFEKEFSFLNSDRP